MMHGFFCIKINYWIINGKNKAMTNEKIKQMHIEIDAVLKKYNVGCLVGLWFSELPNDDAMGLLDIRNKANKDMMIIGDFVHGLNKQWLSLKFPGLYESWNNIKM